MLKHLHKSATPAAVSREPGKGTLLIAALFLAGGLFTVVGSLLLGLGLGFGTAGWLLVALFDIIIALLSLFAAFEVATAHDNGGDSRFTSILGLGLLAPIVGIAAGTALGGVAGVGLGSLGIGIGALLSALGFVFGVDD